jgi:predicted secreted protein
VGKSVKVTATVSGGSSAYEVRVYKKSGSSWKMAVTATLVSSGQYTAYVKATSKGTMQLKAGYVNSSGKVTAWSNVVSVKVKK